MKDLIFDRKKNQEELRLPVLTALSCEHLLLVGGRPLSPISRGTSQGPHGGSASGRGRAQIRLQGSAGWAQHSGPAVILEKGWGEHQYVPREWASISQMELQAVARTCCLQPTLWNDAMLDTEIWIVSKPLRAGQPELTPCDFILQRTTLHRTIRGVLHVTKHTQNVARIEQKFLDTVCIDYSKC